jgi:hypothetical protein
MKIKKPIFVKAVAVLQAHLPADQKPSRPALRVSSERQQVAGKYTDEWLTYSGSLPASVTAARPHCYCKRRSPACTLEQPDTGQQNIEATPIVVDRINLPLDPGHVPALNAKTGDVIWLCTRPPPAKLPQRSVTGLAINVSKTSWTNGLSFLSYSVSSIVGDCHRVHRRPHGN